MSNRKFNVAVVGATGAVGEQIVNLLEKRDFPVDKIKFLSSPRSAGTLISFKGQQIPVEIATPTALKESTLLCLVQVET